LLIKQAEIFYKKELITIEQCQDALLKYSTEEKMKESSFSTQIEKGEYEKLTKKNRNKTQQ